MKKHNVGAGLFINGQRNVIFKNSLATVIIQK